MKKITSMGRKKKVINNDGRSTPYLSRDSFFPILEDQIRIPTPAMRLIPASTRMKDARRASCKRLKRINIPALLTIIKTGAAWLSVFDVELGLSVSKYMNLNHLKLQLNISH